MGSRIIGCGSYLPPYILTNEELTRSIDSSVEWIKTRTGIDERRIAKSESNIDMAYKASLLAIEDSGIRASDLDLIVVATTSADQVFPSLASRLQNLLSIHNVPAFDLQAVCSGFVYGIHIVDSLIKSGKHKNVLLVGSEKMSQIINWKDRSTCILFGDGAGAVIIQNQDFHDGIIDTQILSDGSKHDILFSEHITNPDIDQSNYGAVTMNGREVFKLAISYMKSSIDELLQKNNLDISQINLIIPHQANARITENLVEKFGIDDSKIINTISKHGNCSSASIPLAIDYAVKNNRLKKGDLVVLVAFGSGITWGSSLLRW